MANHKFRFGDRVELHTLGGDKLEGKRGKVIGVSSFHATCIFYIVELDEPTKYDGQFEDFGECTAITMINHCLRKISNF